LLGMARADGFDADTQAEPPDGELVQVEQGMGGSEGHAVVAADIGGQTALRTLSSLVRHGQVEQEGTRGNRKESNDAVCGAVVQRLERLSGRRPRVRVSLLPPILPKLFRCQKVSPRISSPLPPSE
jgi:hypothetical protein